MPVLLSWFVSDGIAAEVQFDGFYRARMRAFDTLVLSRDVATNPELLTQHRLWLQPKFLLTDDVAVFVQLRGFDGLTWGTAPAADVSAPGVFEYDLDPPTGTTADGLLDISLWRAWAEVYTPVGQFKFGRVPLMWGSGIWQNDGLSVDPLYADHGDTTDRFMWEYLVQNQFYFRASVDTVAERLVDGTNDDTVAAGIAIAYRAEDLSAGITLQLDHTGSGAEDVLAGELFTADGAAEATLGPLDLAAEVAGQFGGGTLNGQPATVAAIGASLEASLGLDAFDVRLRGGFASGDSNTGDEAIRTFTFDRDYSPGMFLFEQPALVLGLEDADDPVLMAGAVSNALFVKPSISREIVDGFTLDAAWLGARVARSPRLGAVNQSRSYGNEFQLGASYAAIQHLIVDGRFGAFIPGTQYSRNAAATADTGFDRPVFGFQLTGKIDF